MKFSWNARRVSQAFILSCLLTLGWLPRGLAAGPWTFDVNPAQSQVDFHAIGRPAAIKIHGTGKGVTGIVRDKGGKVSGDLTLDLNTLDTGINLRNEHMKKKYLQTDQFPKAVLAIQDIQLPNTFPVGDATLDAVPFKGKLTLHGVSQDVTGQAKITKRGATVNATAHFSTKISDYKIPVPSFSGVTVADKVDVDVTVQGALKK